MPLRPPLLAALALGPVLAFAGCRDTVTGTVQDASGLAGRVEAQSGPSGGNPSGTALFGSPDSSLAPRWDLKVTCLSASGHTAIVGFTGTLSTFIGFGETYPTAGLIRAVDGGATGSGLDSLEFASTEGPQDGAPIPGPTTCSSYPGPYPGQHGPIVNNEGDLVVTDGAPPPTSKEGRLRGLSGSVTAPRLRGLRHAL
jgi:hypothetical protein